MVSSACSNRPDLLIRAARHYEGAEQVLRRQAVLTATKVVNHRKCNDYFQGTSQKIISLFHNNCYGFKFYLCNL